MSAGKLILISGAVRSGKSSFAEKVAMQKDESVAYLATAQPLDDEMKERIRQHRLVRPDKWQTFEEPYDISSVIKRNHAEYSTWLLDCVTMLISNLYLAKIDNLPQEKLTAVKINEIQGFIMAQFTDIIETVFETGVTMIAVTNEIGWGIVPANPLTRGYRDIVGLTNQMLAAKASEVYLVSLGIPLKIKPKRDY